jgi:hypothetical protein
MDRINVTMMIMSHEKRRGGEDDLAEISPSSQAPKEKHFRLYHIAAAASFGVR